MLHEREQLETYLDRLTELPFVREVLLDFDTGDAQPQLTDDFLFKRVPNSTPCSLSTSEVT